MNNCRSTFLLSMFLLMVLFTSCKSQIEKPNIVWITSEDNSALYMKMFDEHGVETPNIEKLAESGVIYTHAFSNAPVCSAARSTLISGYYGPKLASHYHRNLKETQLPESAEMFPYYLREAGYYTVNNSKEDYNLTMEDTVWDESSKKASWKNRADGQPFFYVYNIGTTHESCVHFSKQQMESNKTITNPDSCFVLPIHPPTDLFKYTNAYYRDKVVTMDGQVGAVVEELENEGLLENTFIFYFGDNGGVLPGSKGYGNEQGVHVPLVVYIPPKYRELVNSKPGTSEDAFVSFVDFGATVLNIAGIKLPKGIDGKPFLGKNITKSELETKDVTFSYADRMDEKYDMVRAVRKGKYEYIRNYQPFNFDGLMNNYRYKQLAFKEWQTLFENNQLNDLQSEFWRTKPAEALYNLESDPYETTNLAENPDYKKVLKEMRNELFSWQVGLPDLSFYPEFVLVKEALSNPINFGIEHKQDITNYMHIANLALDDYSSVKNKISESLKSSDRWERYWGLIVCSSFGKDASEMVAKVKDISETDSEPINKVRAAEFLGLIGVADPAPVMIQELYNCKDAVEALLILNSITLMKDGEHHYSINIDEKQIDEEVLESTFIQWRLQYLLGR